MARVLAADCLLASVLLLQSAALLNASPWKPIVGSSSTSFSVKQMHPQVKTSSDDSQLLADHAASSSIALATATSASGLKDDDIFARFEGHDSSALPAAYLNADRYGYTYDEGPETVSSFLGEDGCAMKKYAFNADGIAEYRNKLPELNQFTICFWMRFTNHSGDHVILTYSAEHDPRELQFWIANAKNSSFISMAIKGQQVYRLNYPLRPRQWHHTCSSWNGKTGEWQVWLKAERIGRGFHNALVGHKIPAAGKLYSGGPSPTALVAQGLHFEITLVQVYRIALSAGKAHRDHKHHHAHTFDHNGQELSITTRAPPAINRPLPMQSALANGQIPTRVRINLAQAGQHQQQQPQQFPSQPQPQLQPGSYTINTNFMNGQINTGSRFITQQVLGLRAAPPAAPNPTPLGIINPLQNTAPQSFNFVQQGTPTDNPLNVQYIDETETRFIFKRQAKQVNGTKATTLSEANKKKGKAETNQTNKTKRHTEGADATLQKRELVLLNDGSVVDDSEFDLEYTYDGLAEFGGKQFKQDLSDKMNLADEVAEHDREPAEEEVKAVMALCGACDVEPFQGAIVFAWKDVKTQLDNSLKGYTVGRCGNF